MNREVWTQAEAVKFAAMLALFKQAASRWKWLYWFGGCLVLVYSAGALGAVILEKYWLALLQMAALGWTYRQWKKFGRKAAQYRDCCYHAQRSLVEENSRVLWHLKQLGDKLEQIAMD